MKREKNAEEIVERHLELHSTLPSEEMAQARERLIQRLRSEPAATVDASRTPSNWTRSFAWRRFAMIPTAAAVVVAVLLAITWRKSAFAVVESVEGSLYVEGKSQAIQVGEKVGVDTPMRTGVAGRVVLKLPDGARIEMQSKSGITLESTEDGMRVRLRSGSVKVTPAQQPAGNLYLQSKEATIRVVAETLQFAETAVPTAIQASDEPQLAFEVASIRPRSNAPAAPGARGGAGRAGPEGCGSPGMPQVDAGRFAIGNIALQGLIVLAYSDWFDPRGGCMAAGKADLLTGGPGWVRSDQWDIQAKIPAGTPAYTGPEFWEGGAPEVHMMLQTLLKDRFKVVLRHETREMPVYLLKVSKNGPKFNGHGQLYQRSVILDGDGKLKKRSEMPPMTGDKGTWGMVGSGLIDAENLSMTEWTTALFSLTGRTVFDRTGLSGRYDFNLEFDRRNEANGLNLRDAMKEQIGLELEEGKSPVEVWVIERAEKPSEN